MVDDPAARRLEMGLATLQGTSRQGFFSPYRHADSVPPTVATYREIAAMLAEAQPAMDNVLADIGGHGEVLRGFGGDAPAPHFRQDWFPRLDGAAAYALVSRQRPQRIVEIGSGHSTRFMARAIADGGFACEFSAIDPQPRAAVTGLPVRWIKSLFGEVHVPLVDALEAGDILFIDSSHILWPGSDVDTLFARLLPRLAPGVIVHIHDVFLPDGYPEHWHWRGYTEQQGVAAMLAGGGFDILFSSHFAITRGGALDKAPVLNDLPILPEACETSLWVRKTNLKMWRP